MLELTHKPLYIFGPCAIESRDRLEKTAEAIIPVIKQFGLQKRFILKASYKKANRRNKNSYSGSISLLPHLHAVGKKYGVPILTDIHTDAEALMAGRDTPYLQIPAFLSRQTDLIRTVAMQCPLFFCKIGQFMTTQDAVDLYEKRGTSQTALICRGTQHGYGDVVIDPRMISYLVKLDIPMGIDITHTLPGPGVIGNLDREDKVDMALDLARMGLTLGCRVIYGEWHYSPENAYSDINSQLPTDMFLPFMETLLDFEKRLWG